MKRQDWPLYELNALVSEIYLRENYFSHENFAMKLFPQLYPTHSTNYHTVLLCTLFIEVK